MVNLSSRPKFTIADLERPRNRNGRFVPWSVEEQSARYVVRDRGGQALASILRMSPAGQSAAKLLT
jgi:hypothetical protein